jgi:serine/threonine protein kinase
MSFDKGEPETSSVIGEGSYGCVHEPSLECNASTRDGKIIDYTNLVSKLMTTSSASMEEDTYRVVSQIDPLNKFHLGNPSPFNCRIDNNIVNRKSIKKCNIVNNTSTSKVIDDYRLFIMPYGGITLEKLSILSRNRVASDKNQARMHIFWIEAHRMLRAIKTMYSAGIVHNDIKINNIVYIQESNRLNLIDFGFMNTNASIVESSKDGNHWLSNMVYWAIPLETRLYNLPFYKSLTMSNVKIIKNSILGVLYSNKYSNRDELIKSYYDDVGKAIGNITSSARFKVSNLSKRIVYDISNDFNLFLSIDLPKLTHSQLLEKSLKTVDIYGLGISYMEVLLSSEHIISKSLAKDLYLIFYRMFTPRLSERYTINNLMDDYENILYKHGIMQEYDVVFDNHQLRQSL